MNKKPDPELLDQEFSQLIEVYEGADHYDKKQLRQQLLQIRADQAKANLANAESQKLKYQSAQLITEEMKRIRAEVWARPTAWICIAVVAGLTVATCIFGVEFVRGYWQYWSGR